MSDITLLLPCPLVFLTRCQDKKLFLGTITESNQHESCHKIVGAHLATLRSAAVVILLSQKRSLREAEQPQKYLHWHKKVNLNMTADWIAIRGRLLKC